MRQSGMNGETDMWDTWRAKIGVADTNFVGQKQRRRRMNEVNKRINVFPIIYRP